MQIEKKIPDFTHLTCTNLMLKLKILSKKMNSGNVLEFLSTREQKDNILTPFSKHPFHIEAEKYQNNQFYIKIQKIEL